jgi:hypothetical protein
MKTYPNGKKKLIALILKANQQSQHTTNQKNSTWQHHLSYDTPNS